MGCSRTLVLLVESTVAATPAKGVALGVALTVKRRGKFQGSWGYGWNSTNPKDEVPEYGDQSNIEQTR
jgi:hypothetical protein